MWTVNLPATFQLRLQTVVDGIAAVQRYASPFKWLLYPSGALEFLTLGALGSGLLVTVLPWARAAYLERRFRLRPPPSLPALAHIREFIDSYGPGLLITVNLSRANQLAFVYPRTYRKAALAIFGGMVRLWQTDRKAAEAILLHEIAHYRRGDILMVGTGSFLEALVRYALPVYLIVFLLPSIVVSIDDHLRFRAQLEALTGAGTVSTDSIRTSWFYAQGYGWITVNHLFRVLASLVLLLGCIWSAELNADRYAREKQGTSEAICRALDKLSGTNRWWRWVLLRLSHPPVAVRRRLLSLAEGHALLWLLLVFPVSYVVLLAALHGAAMTAYIAADMASEFWGDSIENTKLFFANNWGSWVGMSAVLVSWPFVWTSWERIFTRERRQVRDRADVGIYMLCALTTAVVGVVGYFLST
jgi:Zn-dependent protease with chaperone function